MRFPLHIKAFVGGETWTFAWSYAETWPHEYRLRQGTLPGS